jgi:hypothetical protein
MNWWWDLLKAMDAHEGQAAWAQGFFSVSAVIAAILIDMRSAHRQRKQFESASAEARREKAELALAIWVQAGQILAHSENVWVALSTAGTTQATAVAKYEEWASDTREQVDLLKVLLERASDPILVLHAVAFIRAARPKVFPSLVVRSTYITAINNCVEAMRLAKKGLSDKSAAMSKAAGLKGSEFLVPAEEA